MLNASLLLLTLPEAPCALPWCHEGAEGNGRYCWKHFRGRDDAGEPVTLDRHEARVDRIARRRAGLAPKAWYVYASEVARRRGGPEEGGWYYDEETRVALVAVRSVREALAAVRQLRAENPANPRSRFSAVGGGYDVVVSQAYSLDDVPSETPPPRPRYE